MPVSPDSRFAQQPLLHVLSPDGTPQVAVALPLDSKSGGDGSGTGTYRLSQEQALDLVAKQVYGDESLWWRILDANPVVYPFDLKAGDALKLPPAGVSTAAVRTRTF